MDTGKFQAKTRRVQVANTCLDKPVVMMVAENQQELFARPAFRTGEISLQPPLAFYPPLLPLFYGLLNLRRNLRFAEMVEIAPRMDLAFGRNFPPSSPLCEEQEDLGGQALLRKYAYLTVINPATGGQPSLPSQESLIQTTATMTVECRSPSLYLLLE